jgi:glycerol-3-phosphate dehydrogenase (NAD(P)+)
VSAAVSATRPIAVLGAGAFGTALAIQLSRRGNPTLLWGRDAAAMSRAQSERENARYLPNCPLPAPLQLSGDFDVTVAGAGDLLIATPMSALHETCHRLAPLVRADQGIACACKGLEPGTGRLVHEVIAAELGAERPLAIVSGPTFARELALGLPTAVTVAANQPQFAESIAAALHGDGFRAYTSDDVIGVEIGGATKNVLAIAVGIADGLGMGANTRSAMITRGLNEIARLGEALGARRETLMGMAGLGDLVLTCTDNQSRNRRFGLLLGQGRTPAQALAEINSVVEGARAAAEVRRLAQRHGVEMPLCEHVAAILEGEITPLEAVTSLATRPLRAEDDLRPADEPR